jgi:hypothetical protein
MGLLVGGCLERRMTPLGPCVHSARGQQILDVGVPQTIEVVVLVDPGDTSAPILPLERAEWAERMRRGDLELDGVTEFFPATSLRLVELAIAPDARVRDIALGITRARTGAPPPWPGFSAARRWTSGEEPEGAAWLEASSMLAVVIETPRIDAGALDEALRDAPAARTAVMIEYEDPDPWDTLLFELASQRCPFCALPRRRDERGLVPCELHEVLSPSGPAPRCVDLPGRTLVDVEVDADGRLWEVCALQQLDQHARQDGDATGWYLDERSIVTARLCGRAARIVRVGDAALPDGAWQGLVCARATSAGTAAGGWWCDRTGTACEVGSFCDPQEEDACGRSLRCDVIDRVCASPCASDADCVEAGLFGQVCDLRSHAEAAGAGRLEHVPAALRAEPRGVCAHPRCG